MKANFSMTKALGTGTVTQATSSFATIDPWNLRNQYGVQPYDEKFIMHLFFNYAPPFFSSQKGVLGRILGGWNISPLFIYGSGFPVEINTLNGDCGSLGECNTSFVGANENMVGTFSYTAGRHQGAGITDKSSPAFGCGTTQAGQNILSNAQIAATCPTGGGIFGDALRNPILGLDGHDGNFPVRGFPFWNLDLGLSKQIRLTERFNATLHVDSTNVLNHMQPNEPCFNASAPQSWGAIGSSDCSALNGNVQGNEPRRIQFGLALHW
jgi:hypothetical protein